MHRFAVIALAAVACSRPSGSPSRSAAPTSAPAATASATAITSAAPHAALTAIELPGGAGGIGFDDLRWAPKLGKFLVPGGRTGKLYLVDPDGRGVGAIGGFSETKYDGSHDAGVTSADEGRGLLFATDRTAKKLLVVDPAAGAVVASAPLEAGPDYVRFLAVGGSDSVWVSEPDGEKLEVFGVPPGPSPTPKPLDTLGRKDGPESLALSRRYAFTHGWHGHTFRIDVGDGPGTADFARAVADWPNGCEGSRGIDLARHGEVVLVGCAEGKVTALDAGDGRITGRADVGKGVDIIAYAAERRRLYVPAKDGTLALIDVSAAGELTVARTLPAPKGAHCVAADPVGHRIVCDPERGALAYHDDTR